MKYSRITSTRVGLQATLFSGLLALATVLACSTTPTIPPPGGGSGGDLPGTGGGVASGGAVAAVGGAGGSPGSGGGAPASGGSVASGGSSGSGGAGTGGGSGGASDSGGIIPGTAHYNCDPPVGDVPELQLTTYIATDLLELPIYLTHAPDETDRLFVLEQAGRILVVKNGVVNPVPFLDIIGRVSMDPWEQGLLGLAFHPDYAQNGLFYIHYSALNVAGVPNQANVVAEYHVSATDPDVADPTERIVLFVDTDHGDAQYTGYHNGGSIFFGQNADLFIALGDGAGRGPGVATTNAQNLATLRGKLARINPLEAGNEPYTTPPGNLKDVNASALPEIWSYGLRNPYRTNIDPCTGDIYIGDVGHFDWEEVDVEPAGDGHHNYGWPIREGEANGPVAGSLPTDYRAPVLDFEHSGAGTGAVIGGSVYRGSAIPGLRGTYFFSDLYTGTGGTRTFKYDGGADTITAIVSVEEQTNVNQAQQTLVAIQSGGDGELYFIGRGGYTDPMNTSITFPSTIYKLEAYVP